MTTEFSPPYHVVVTTDGFTIVNSKGGHEAIYSNRKEAEEIVKMMNQQADFRRRLSLARESRS
jgi:hypothetical protein